MRRTGTLLAVAALVAVLAACGSDATPSANPLPPPTPSASLTSSAPAPAPTDSPTPSRTASPSPSASTVTGPVFKVDKTTKLVKPRSFSLGSFRAPSMAKITWTTWSPTGAVGTGDYAQYVCTDQACSESENLKTPAKVTLSRVKDGAFTKMTFASQSSTEIPIDSYTFNGRVWG